MAMMDIFEVSKRTRNGLVEATGKAVMIRESLEKEDIELSGMKKELELGIEELTRGNAELEKRKEELVNEKGLLDRREKEIKDFKVSHSSEVETLSIKLFESRIGKLKAENRLLLLKLGKLREETKDIAGKLVEKDRELFVLIERHGKDKNQADDTDMEQGIDTSKDAGMVDEEIQGMAEIGWQLYTAGIPRDSDSEF
ncbi:hypothetical protein ACHAP3_011183 [Botrytis cinerea]